MKINVCDNIIPDSEVGNIWCCWPFESFGITFPTIYHIWQKDLQTTYQSLKY